MRTQMPATARPWLVALSAATLTLGISLSGTGLPRCGLLAATEVGPRVRLSESKHAFKDLLQGESFEYTILVHNDGDADLILDKVLPSCSCTKVTAYDETLSPGASGKIQILVDTKKIKAGGVQRKEVRIFSNDLTQPRAVFSFTAEVESLFRTDPPRVQLAGVVDQPKQATVSVFASTTHGLEILEAKSRGGQFKVTEITQVEKDRHYRITLTSGPAPRAGELKDPLDLTIRVRDGRTVTVGTWVYIAHRDHILVSPVALKFLNRDTNKLLVDKPKPIGKPIVVASTLPETTFEIQKIEIDGIAEGVFTTELKTLIEGRRYAITVGLAEYQKKSYLRGKILIHTSDPRRALIEVPLQAMFGRRRRH